MITFWTTPANIKLMLGNDYLSYPFFGTIHLAELLIALFIILLVCSIYKKSNNKKRNIIQIIVTILILIDELYMYIFTIGTNQWSWEYLPLHLCSINIFICTLHTINKSDKIKDFLYALCLPGAILALIASPWLTAPILNAMHIHSYTIHVLLAMYPALMLAGGYRPRLKQIPLNGLIIVLIAIPIAFINKLLDTNFLFINKYDEVFITVYLYKFLKDKYYLAFPLLLCILWSLMYLPWNIKRKHLTNL